MQLTGLRNGTHFTRLSPMKELTGTLGEASAFVHAAGLVLDEVTDSRVTGHLQLGPAHHTPWGIVHGGVYSTAIESVVLSYQVEISGMMCSPYAATSSGPLGPRSEPVATVMPRSYIPRSWSSILSAP